MTDRPTDTVPLHSVHTSNFPAILQNLGISLAISTYQAGKLIIARADGNSLNTHFRIFKKPMGLAVDYRRMAIGCAELAGGYYKRLVIN